MASSIALLHDNLVVMPLAFACCLLDVRICQEIAVVFLKNRSALLLDGRLVLQLDTLCAVRASLRVRRATECSTSSRGAACPCASSTASSTSARARAASASRLVARVVRLPRGFLRTPNGKRDDSRSGHSDREHARFRPASWQWPLLAQCHCKRT